MSAQDSIMATSDLFLASGGLPVAETLEWIERVPVGYPGWLYMLFFILASLLAWIKYYYGSIVMTTIQASANFQVASRMFLDNSVLQRQLDNILYAYYFFSFGFLVFVIETRFGLMPYGLEGFRLFLFNVAILSGFFLLKTVLVRIAGFLFNRFRIFREYLYNTQIYNKLIGIVLLPFLLLSVYTSGLMQDLFFWVTVVVAIVVLIMRLIRATVFSFKKDVSIFYMFLYLCALEIVPLLLFYKWLEGIL